MKQVIVEKEIETIIRWLPTICKIRKGEMCVFEAFAEDGNKVRVAASVLNKKRGQTTPSVLQKIR